MKKVRPQADWPQSWKESYPYDLAEIYNQPEHLGYAYAYDNRRKHTLELVKSIASPGSKILDVAAAQGNFSLALAELGYDVTWNDLRGELVDYVKMKYERGNLNFAPGNVFDLGFASLFDVVLITEIIEHVAHPDEFLAKISHLTKPGGYIVMTTPNGGYFLNKLPKFSECADPSQFEDVQFKPNADGHIFLLHQDELEALARQANLRVLDVDLYTNPLTNGHVKTEALLKVLPRGAVQLVENATCRLPKPLRTKMCTGMAILFQRPTDEFAQTSKELPDQR